MNRKNISKLLATILVITLTFANVLMLDIYANKTYATEENLDNQSVVTNNPNVEFDAYYVDKSNKTSHSIKQNINSQDLQLHLYAKVTKGYLKDIKIAMFGEEETNSTNFTISNTAKDLNTVESVDASTNTLKLKQIDKDKQVIIKVPVYANKEDVYDISNFNKQNNIKITATYVNDNGKEISIKKTVKTAIQWEAQINAIMEQEVAKNINIGNKKGMLLQTILRTGLQNSNLPIQQTEINVKVPTIAGIKPEKVIVIANQTNATNGKEGAAFNSENWNYNEEKGILNIKTKNEPTENKIAWNKTQKDEYVVTYIFPETVLEKVTPELKAKQEVTTKITAYGATTQESSATQVLEIDVATAKGKVISNEILNSMNKLSKGYFYSNVNKNIEYTTKNVVQIPNVDLINNIEITNNAEELLVGEQGVSLNNSSYTMSLINKEIFNTLLGEDGYIKIYKTNGELITTINKETTVENGNYIYNYETTVNAIKIETSKPLTEGNLIIENKKVINCNTNYTSEQITSFSKLRTSAEVTYNNQETTKVYKDTLVELIEPETKIEAEISKSNLSTVVKNEGVQIKVILKTNDETCMLYENPVVEVELPNYIENIEINSINLGYDKDLSYDESKLSIVKNNAGNSIIRIPLIGKDTDYNFDNLSKGANLIIDANLTIGKLTPTTKSKINVNVQNNNGKQQTASSQIDITAIAPVGMVATTQVSAYNARNAKAIALNGQEQTIKLDVNADERTASVQMDIINNYNNICKNISILGQIPYKIATLKTPITLRGVEASKITVYYTNNENVSNDLSVKSNGWTTNIENLSQVKSYLIIVEDFEMGTGKNIVANYDLLIPAKLNYNLESSLTYTVYYDNVTKDQTIKDSTMAARTTLTTGQGPELEVSIKSDRTNGAEIQEGSIIKYTVSVKNIGKTAVENVVLKGNIPERTVYFKYEGSLEGEEGIEQVFDNTKKEYSKKIDVIQPGETKTIEYNVQVQNLYYIDSTLENEHEEGKTYEDIDDDNVEIDDSKLVLENIELNVTGEATVNGYDKVFSSETLKNKVVQGFVNVTMEVSPIPANITRLEAERVQLLVRVVNVGSEDKKNAVVTYNMPEDLAFEGCNNNGKYDEKTHTITWNIDTIKGKDTKNLVINTRTIQLEENVFEKEIKNKAVVKIADKQAESNEVTIKVQKPSLVANLSTDTSSEVNVGDEIRYNATIENNGKGVATRLTIVDVVSEGLVIKKAQYTYEGDTYSANMNGDTKLTITIPSLKAGDKVEIEIIAKAEALEDGENSKEVMNGVAVTSKEIDVVNSNVVTHTVLPKGTTKDPSTNGDVVENTYKISGMAWLDQNKNGRREDEETKLNNIEVMLINADNGQIVKDIKTGNNKIQTTNEEGSYTFSNVEKGKYIVVYLYDTVQYGLTEYRKQGVTTSRNSDAISTKVNKDGALIEVAATDAIEISEGNVYNMDIGLVQKAKFNLSLNKAITKITVRDSKTTKTYEYKDSKLAKIDLDAKKLKDTNIIIEYKITVSNIGDLEGYAKRIVDYVPQDMKFSSELNSDWYTSDNGNLYNSSLANTVIKPGETKELRLILTKTMNENNTGIINNKAEIYEAYNNLGLADIDSTPANKVDSENDMSSADAAISIKTGEIPMYIGITISLIAFFALGIYFIKRKVLTRI